MPRASSASLAPRVSRRHSEQLARLALARGHDLGALALALVAIALDLGLALLELVLLPADFLFGRWSWAAEAFWASRSIVSANSAAARIRCSASIRTACPVGSTLGPSAGRLEDAELRLQLRGVAAEGFERLADTLVVAVAGARELLHRRKRGQPRGRTL